MKRTFASRAAAALVAVALGLAGAVAFAAPASAVGPNIDPDATGTLTIHKYTEPTTPGAPATGVVTTPGPGAIAIAGVVFSITPVTGVDLTTNQGWVDAAQLAADLAADPLDLPTGLGTEVTLPATDVSGVTTAPNLDLGLYLVREVSTGPAPIVSAAAPFLVTMPLPTTGTTPGWNYDVNVYPKNAVAADPVKSVDDSTAYALGDTVTWTVEEFVPQFGELSDIESFVFTDDLDARLEYTSPARVLLGGIEMDAGDYTVSATDPVTVTFTAAGFQTLFDNPGETLTFEIDTVVLDTGTISNTATVTINGLPLTSNAATTTWVPVELSKADADSGDFLAGAVFQVFTSATGGTPLEFGPTAQTDFTSNAGGVVVIPGLKAGVQYWVEEITAPDGYFGLTARVAIPTTGTLPAVPTTPGEVAVYEQTIENDQIPEWQLPLTGGNGPLWFAVGGGALVMVAIGAALVAARRKKSQV